MALRRSNTNCWLVFQLVAFAILVAGPLRASFDEQFLDGLRERRLFSLAETHCLEQLARPELTGIERADLTVELIRIRTARAVNALPERRQAHWQSAHQAAERFLGSSQPPRRVLVRVQRALTHLAHGQLIRQEFEVGAASANGRERALAELRLADRALTEIDDQLTKEIPLRRRRQEPGQLTADELFALQNNVRYHRARAYRNRALCYEAQSADRVDALTRAIEQHVSLARRLPEGAQLRWEIYLESASCYRLLSRLDEARQQLSAMQRLHPPVAMQLRARAEAVRIALADGQHQQALKILARGRTLQGRDSPDLDLAHVEVYTAKAAASAADPSAADRWQQQSVDAAQRVEQLHGPYWARRANLLIVRSARSAGARNLETLLRLAQNLYLNGQFDQAITTYEQAAQRAASDGDPARRFELLYQAGLVEQQRANHAAAADRLRRLALELTGDDRAASAHLLGVWNVAQLGSADTQRLEDYAEWLQEHLAHWPEANTADQARLWLARLREREGSWKEALDLYLEISPTSERFGEAVQAAAECSQKYLAEIRRETDATSPRATALAARFEDLLHGPTPEPDGQLTEAQRTAAVAAARIRLQFLTGEYAAAERILKNALHRSAHASEEWRMTARSLLVVALAGQPARRAEASQMLSDFVQTSPDLLLEMLEGLAGIARGSTPTAREQIGQLQLEAIKRLAAAKARLKPSRQVRLNQLEAAALAATGQTEEALHRYATLAEQQPHDPGLQEQYAELLLETGNPEQLQTALTRWRIIGRRSRPQSPRWYRAKYAIALAYFRIGDKQRAAQLIRYLQTIPPGLKQTPLQPDFQELLRRCTSEP